MTKAKKILFINQELLPYVPESAMATAGRKLPQAIQDGGREIRTFMPKWGNINERRNQLHEVIRLSGLNIVIDDTDHPLIIKVASIQAARMQVYFIDNDDYFHKRLMMTDEDGKEYEDNAERAIFYARGVLETLKKDATLLGIFCQFRLRTFFSLDISVGKFDGQLSDRFWFAEIDARSFDDFHLRVAESQTFFEVGHRCVLRHFVVG